MIIVRENSEVVIICPDDIPHFHGERSQLRWPSTAQSTAALHVAHQADDAFFGKCEMRLMRLRSGREIGEHLNTGVSENRENP